MKYKKVQSYLKEANKIYFNHSIGDAIELQKTLVNEFEKERNERIFYVTSIDCSVFYRTLRLLLRL